MNKFQFGGVGNAETNVSSPAMDIKPSRVRKRQPMALLQEHFPDSGTRAVKFEYINRGASKVFVAGSFNDWQPNATPLLKQRGGKWFTQLFLKPGHYEYRFVVDGQWQDDRSAPGHAENPFGGLNAVIEVTPLKE